MAWVASSHGLPEAAGALALASDMKGLGGGQLAAGGLSMSTAGTTLLPLGEALEREPTISTSPPAAHHCPQAPHHACMRVLGSAPCSLCTVCTAACRDVLCSITTAETRFQVGRQRSTYA
jgi:hypothetical protein